MRLRPASASAKDGGVSPRTITCSSIAAIAALVVPSVAVVGCKQAAKVLAEEVASAPRGKVGETVRVAEFDVTIHAVEDPFVPSTGPIPDAVKGGGDRYLAVDVELVNARGDAEKYSSGWFHLYDAEGHAIEAHYTDNSVKTPHLVEGYLNRGDRARGWVTFQLGAAARPSYVQFFAGYLDGQPANIELE
jgi:hypothetical protein